MRYLYDLTVTEETTGEVIFKEQFYSQESMVEKQYKVDLAIERYEEQQKDFAEENGPKESED